LFKPAYDPRENQRLLEVRVDELRSSLHHLKPNLLTSRTDAVYQPFAEGKGQFLLPFWGREITVTYPEYQVFDAKSSVEENVANQAMVLYHFVTSDGAPLAKEWISFSELPDGRFYNQAFQGYTGLELVSTFGGVSESFKAAAASAGGIRTHFFADAAYVYQLYPRVPLMVVFWAGDEDFPSSIQILFDASVSHHLPTDACAIAGSMLTRRIIKAGG
jgi:hypothetical protein